MSTEQITQAEGDLVQKDNIFYKIVGFEPTLDGTLAVCENTDPEAVEDAANPETETKEGSAGHRSFKIRASELKAGGKIPGGTAVWIVQ